MNDIAIIDLYFKRDERAIEETKISHGSKLTGFAYNILRNSQDSEESVNDTYFKAWNTIPPKRPEHFYAYLSKICRFICFGKLDYKNAQKRTAEIVTLSDELLICIPSNTEKEVDEENFTKVLERFLETLSKENRIIFLRRYWYCESIAEISKKLNFGESKIKTSLFRTRGKLKKYLESEGIFI
ncbi:MAG: RNA polymerase sigma factor [Clostridia bacterium]